MKVCLLTRKFDLSTGGIGRVSTEIRNGLLKLGHEVVSVCTDSESLAGYFKYVFFDLARKIPPNCDVYHAITPMESIWLPKKKSVVTILDIIPVTHPEKHGARMGGNRVKYTIGKNCFIYGCRQAAKCAKVVSISKHVRDEYTKHFNRRPEVIRLGIRNDLEPKPRDDKVFRIGYLGQVDRRKRVDMLVDAFMDSSIEAELWIAGGGTDLSDLRWRSSYDKRVNILGSIPDDAIQSFYNLIDIFIFPTAIEGYGLPPVEAMACKKPVIILRDAIIQGDVKSRCNAVDSLVSVLASKNALLRATAGIDIEGNYRFAKKHNWQQCVTQYVKLYEEILS